MRTSLSPTILVCAAAGWFILPGVAVRGEDAPTTPAQTPPGPTFATEAGNHFASWDADGDGTLTLAELDRAIADAQTRGPAAASAVALRQSLVRAKVEKVSLADAQKDAGTEKTFSWAMKRLEAAPRALYAKETPHPEDIRQGKLGDCFCLAGLRAVLERDPKALASMISAQPDGSYRVRIGTTEVTVPPPTDGEILLGANPEDGLWPIVYEKAVGLYRTKPSDRETTTPFAVVTHGGSAGAMMAKLTAHEITRWSCKAWRDAAAKPDKQAALLQDLRTKLQSAFAEKRLVTAGTDAKPLVGAVPGMTYSHGYAVLGYDAASDEVRLWNPHGDTFHTRGIPGVAHGYPRLRGEWSAPLAEVVTFLAGFAFEKLPTEASTSAPAPVSTPVETSPAAPETGTK